MQQHMVPHHDQKAWRLDLQRVRQPQLLIPFGVQLAVVPDEEAQLVNKVAGSWFVPLFRRSRRMREPGSWFVPLFRRSAAFVASAVCLCSFWCTMPAREKRLQTCQCNVIVAMDPNNQIRGDKVVQ